MGMWKNCNVSLSLGLVGGYNITSREQCSRILIVITAKRGNWRNGSQGPNLEYLRHFLFQNFCKEIIKGLWVRTDTYRTLRGLLSSGCSLSPAASFSNSKPTALLLVSLPGNLFQKLVRSKSLVH